MLNPQARVEPREEVQGVILDSAQGVTDLLSTGRCCCVPTFISKRLICKFLLSESSFLLTPHIDGAAAIHPTYCLINSHNNNNKITESLCGD